MNLFAPQQKLISKSESAPSAPTASTQPHYPASSVTCKTGWCTCRNNTGPSLAAPAASRQWAAGFSSPHFAGGPLIDEHANSTAQLSNRRICPCEKVNIATFPP